MRRIISYIWPRHRLIRAPQFPRSRLMPKAAKKQQEPSGPFGDMFPYRETFETYRELPKKSRQPEDVMGVLLSIPRKENVRLQTGQTSGTFFHGGMEHFAYLNRVFALFSHVNLLHRDMCPSGTK